jgi:hypothetical protein
LQARRFDQESALQHFVAARKFHHEKNILQVYEKVDLSHYEIARLMVWQPSFLSVWTQSKHLLTTSHAGAQWPQWTGRRDRAGQPICVLDVANFDRTVLANWKKLWEEETFVDSLSTDTPLKRMNLQQIFASNLDYLTRFVLPLCSAMDDRPNPKRPVTKVNYVVDASGITLKLGWEVASMAQDVSTLLATSYPETIDRIFVSISKDQVTTCWVELTCFG